MTNEEVVKRVREVLDDAYEEAAYLVVAHVQGTDIALQTFCKQACEGTLYSWQALRSRAQRIQKAAGEAKSARSDRLTDTEKAMQRHAKQVARTNPEVLLNDPDIGPAIEKALIEKDEHPTKTKRPHAEPAPRSLFRQYAKAVWEKVDLAERLKDEIPEPHEVEAMRELVRTDREVTNWIESCIEAPEDIDWATFDAERSDWKEAHK